MVGYNDPSGRWAKPPTGRAPRRFFGRLVSGTTAGFHRRTGHRPRCAADVRTRRHSKQRSKSSWNASATVCCSASWFFFRAKFSERHRGSGWRGRTLRQCDRADEQRTMRQGRRLAGFCEVLLACLMIAEVRAEECVPVPGLTCGNTWRVEAGQKYTLTSHIDNEYDDVILGDGSIIETLGYDLKLGVNRSLQITGTATIRAFDFSIELKPPEKAHSGDDATPLQSNPANHCRLRAS